MKNVVFNDTGREVEFKPDLVFEEYLKLNKKDLERRFKNEKDLVLNSCPACLSDKKQNVFKKSGFQYVECRNCRTVYMSPGPKDVDIKRHYLTSNSARFWRDTLSKRTEGKRKEKIYAPRLQWIVDMAGEYLPAAKTIADLCDKNKDYVQAFLDLQDFENKIVINPYFDVEDIRADCGGLQVIDDLAEAKKKKGLADIISAFEVIDCISDVNGLMSGIKDLLVPGGLCFMTTISISGFDLQVLWNSSKTIFPLDRISVFSSEGLRLLFKRHDFEMLEYSTPGLLDLDIVRNAIERDKKLDVPRFIKTLLEKGDDKLYRDFQEFLQTNRLSSFVRVLLRKK